MRIEYLQQFIALSQVKNYQKVADALTFPSRTRRFIEIILGK